MPPREAPVGDLTTSAELQFRNIACGEKYRRQTLNRTILYQPGEHSLLSRFVSRQGPGRRENGFGCFQESAPSQSPHAHA